ncbi:MAG: hypothetical protein GWN32_05860 [Gemmatimonadetes bacterium]|nr:hypothetical protein [Gemmatimonadota bacterium]
MLTPITPATLLRGQTERPFTYKLGKSFALLGITIGALQFVLAARLQWVE